MYTILYAIIGVIIILVLGPVVFADRSPIPETSGNVHKVSESSQLDVLSSSNTYVVIDFYADWCPPCRAIAPVFSKLADEHASVGHLAFAKVNVDHVKDVAKRFGISAMPTFLVIQNGKVKEVAVRSKGNVAGGAAEKMVERIQGADVATLRGVVHALTE